MNISSIGNLATSGFQAPRPVATDSSALAADTRQAPLASVTDQAVQPANNVQPSRAELDKAVKAVNDFVGSVNNSLNFSVDDSTGKTIVKVIDSSTKEVLKQFPSEEMLSIAKALDGIKGLLVQQKA